MVDLWAGAKRRLTFSDWSFERVRQRVVLSEAGERLLPQVRRLLRNAEDMMTGALSLSPEQQLLRVGVLPTFGARWLVPRLGRFSALHPEIELAVDPDPNLADFRAGEFELGIRSIPALKLFKNGQQVSEMVGAAPKARLQQWIDSAV